jgi:PiT family inorganic phosphate transporter
MGSLFNFVAYWIFELKVADTVAKTVKPQHIDLVVVLAGLSAAIFWNLLTWWQGIPSSSSHTLIGGFAGAGAAHAGSLSAINVSAVLPVVYFIVLAPIIGMILSYFISVITMHLCKRANPSKVDKILGVCNCYHQQLIV